MRAHLAGSKNRVVYFFVVMFFVMKGLNASAQESYIYLNGHAGVTVPANKAFSENFGFGSGIDVGGGIAVMHTYLTGKVGYSRFFKKSGSSVSDLNYIPVTFGLRQYFNEEFFYVYGDAGFAFINSKSMYKGETKFTGGVGLGLKFDNRVEAQIGYHGVNSKKPYDWISWFELKVGYNWGL